jgi:hypothetical protein
VKRTRAEVVCDDRPEPLGGRIQVCVAGVEAARAFVSCREPFVVRQHLQVAADGGLRESQHSAEFPNGQLVLIEGEQDPSPGGVGERRESVVYL